MPIETKVSATVPLHPAQQQNENAVAVKTLHDLSVKTSNAVAAPQVAAPLPLHCSTMEAHPNEDRI